MHEHSRHHHHGSTPHDPESWLERLDDPGRDAWQKPSEVVAAMEMAEGMVVADVGAGTGYFESYLSRAVGTDGSVFALDVHPELVARMRRRFEDAGLSNVEARLVSPEDLGLKAKSVDRVLIVDAWHHMSDRVAYARKLGQALRPAGRIVIVDYLIEAPQGPPAELRLSPEAVVAELRVAGFTARISANTLPNQFIAIGELAAAER